MVDLAVGLWAWPLPMDYDGDGDLDLVVSCSDKPYNGTYFFENPGGDVRQPVFKPAVQVGPGFSNIQASYVNGQVRLLVPGRELVRYKETGFGQTAKIYPTANVHANKVRANQWKLADYDGDGRLDLIVGVGDWTDYGWDDAFDAQGHWTHGPLRGYVYLLRNTASNNAPAYEPPRRLEAGGEPIGGYGMPSPNLADFDGDGDLDLLCGEFLDKFTYYQNVGTRTAPRYDAGRRIVGPRGEPVAMDLEMIVPVAVDWDHDGDLDLIVGDEDGRVALVENTGNRGRRAAAVPPPGLLPPGGRRREIRRPGDALRRRLGRRWRRGPHLRQFGRLPGLHREPGWRQPSALGRASEARGGRQGDPHHGRPERLDPGPLRGQVGLYRPVRCRLGPRRLARYRHQLDLGRSALVPQRRHADRAQARPGPACRGRLAATRHRSRRGPGGIRRAGSS